MADLNEVLFQQIYTDIANGQMEDIADFAATKAFNMFTTNRRSGTFKQWKLEDLLRCNIKQRGDTSAYDRASKGLQDVAFATESYGREELLGDYGRGEMGSNPDQEFSNGLVMEGYRNLENKMFSIVFADNAFNEQQQGVASGATANQFIQFNETGATIVATIKAAAKKLHNKTGVPTRQLEAVVTSDVMDYLLESTEILARKTNTTNVGDFKVTDEMELANCLV
jgi:hypothetical protein